jgi:spermidine synthase
MGLTLPLGVKILIWQAKEFKSSVGRLYGVNTVGAGLGAFFAGFLLLPKIGLKASTDIAASINMIIGLVALLLARRIRLEVRQNYPISQENCVSGDKRNITLHSLVICIFYGLCGLTSMIYEIAWTRNLALIIGSSTYAFSCILTTFILGLGAGSVIFAKIYKRREVSFKTWAILQLILGTFTLFSIPLFNKLPYLFLLLFKFSEISYTLLYFIYFFISSLIILLPTLIMGATFPLVATLYLSSLKDYVNREGRGVGVVYGANTVGCLLGSFAAGFLFIPYLGAELSLNLASYANIFIGIILLSFLLSFLRKIEFFSAVLILLVILRLILPTLNKELLTSGVSIYVYSINGLKEAIRQMKLLYYRDGHSCTVSVHKDPISKRIYLRVNGKTDATDKADMPTQILSAYIPLLYLDNPKKGVVIGLGSGVTAGCLGISPIEKVYCIEIEPAVIEAAKLFQHVNHKLFSNPKMRKKVKIIVEDGRSFLACSKEKYDLIISEPSNPWIKGCANLFTEEFYNLCAKRLRKGGIMAQWLQLYSLFPHDFVMIIRTFYKVFPHLHLWQTLGEDIIIIGSQKPLVLSHSNAKRLGLSKEITKDLALIGINRPLELFTRFLSPGSFIKPLSDDKSTKYLNTDDLNLLEFNAPKALYYPYTHRENLKALKLLDISHLPPLKGFIWTDKWKALFYYYAAEYAKERNLLALAERNIELSCKYNPNNIFARIFRAQIYILKGKILLAEAELKKVIRLAPNNLAAKRVLKELYRHQGLLKSKL